MIKKLEYDKVTIYEVESLQKELLELINAIEDELVLDFSQVSKVDMTSIQILISAQKSCKEKAIPFSLINLSTGLKETLESCGCSTILGVQL